MSYIKGVIKVIWDPVSFIRHHISTWPSHTI